MFKKYNTIKMGFLIVIVFFTIFHNQENILGKEKPEGNLPDLNNPLPVYPPDDVHIWNDRLYFQHNYVIYRYDISDKQNITFVNHLQVDSGETFVDYYENKLFTIDVNYKQRKDESTLTINTYDLTDDKFDLLSTREVIINIRISELNLLSGYILFIEEFPIDEDLTHSYYIPLNDSNIYTFPEGITSDGSYRYFAPTTLLENNLLYILALPTTSNQFVLQIFDMIDPINPVLVGNCSFITNYMSYSSLQKTDNMIYTESTYSALQIFNVTDKMNPIYAGNFTFPIFGLEIQTSNHYATTVNNYNLELYNLSSLDTITLVDSYDLVELDYAYGLDIFQDLIVLSHLSSISLFDWSDPTNIIFLTYIQPPYIEKVGFNPFLMFPNILLFFYFVQKRKKRKN